MTPSPDGGSQNGTIVRFDSIAGCYRIDSYRSHSQSVTTLVVKAVATATNQNQFEIDPLANVIDPEALNELFESPTGHALESKTGKVQFNYCQCSVTVSNDGTITVSPPEGKSPED